MSLARTHRFSTIDLLTLAVLAATFALTAVVYDQLPVRMATHFDLQGRPNGWMPRSTGAWIAPALSVVVVALMRFAGMLLPSGWSERLAASPVRFISFVTATFMLGTQALALRAATSAAPHLGGSIWVIVGALLVAMGLALPRTRRNVFFGVRTAFALTSDENWARTQRVGGYAMTSGGVIMIGAGLCEMPAVAITALLVSVFVPVAWSWIVARRGPGDVPPLSSNK